MSKQYKEFVSKRQIYRRVSAQLQSLTVIANGNEEVVVNNESLKLSICNSGLIQNVESDVTDTEEYQSNIENDVENNCLGQVGNINVSENACVSSCNESIVSSTESCSEIQTDIATIETYEGNLQSSLRQWALKKKISHTALKDLLKILIPLHPDLPHDPRTLLKTPLTNATDYIKINNGEYYYFGIKNVLLNCDLVNILPSNDFYVELSFNIDGLPLFNSSTLQFWPILGLIKNSCLSVHPFVISVYCGKSKPAPLEQYLEDFITELNDLLTVGININGQQYSIKIHSFICDAPARAFIKCTKYHSGYSSCDKCSQVGTYYKNRVIFRETNATKRTDESFFLQLDEDHHSGSSPLLRLNNIGLVSFFPIDYMHCVCLGVMKKLISSWLGGNLNIRLSARFSNLITSSLLNLNRYIPVEFNRKPRGLDEVARWKATEFRMFLLYLGPIVLKNNIDLAIYEHFLLLHYSISILSIEYHISTIRCGIAEDILIAFVNHSSHIYGMECLIYNVHLLVHITDDVKKYGHLDSFSTFPFENTLGQLKSLIRSPNKPLQQIHRRIVELNYSLSSTLRNHSLQFFYEHFDGPLPQEYHTYKQYKKMYFNNGMTLSVAQHSSANSYCFLKNNYVVQINNILKFNDNTFLICKYFSSYSSLYTYPFKSENLNIFVVNSLSSELKVFSTHDVLAKCMILPLDDNTLVSLPLLHYND